MDNRKAFQLAELSGRDKALKALNQVFLFEDFSDYKIIPTNDWCKWDFEVRDNFSNELLAVVEAKDRFMESTDRKLIYGGGAQLEAKKYEPLREKAINEEIDVFYLCTYTDNMFYIWDIKNCNVTEDKRMCNKTTAVLTEKIEKHCYYFPMRSAKFKGKI